MNKYEKNIEELDIEIPEPPKPVGAYVPATRVSAINCLAAIKGEIGSLNEIKKIVKVRGFVSSAQGFNEQPEVVNGASEILHEIFGENGVHARSAVGVSELPINIPVEVEMVVSIK